MEDPTLPLPQPATESRPNLVTPKPKTRLHRPYLPTCLPPPAVTRSGTSSSVLINILSASSFSPSVLLLRKPPDVPVYTTMDRRTRNIFTVPELVLLIAERVDETVFGLSQTHRRYAPIPRIWASTICHANTHSCSPAECKSTQLTAVLFQLIGRLIRLHERSIVKEKHKQFVFPPTGPIFSSVDEKRRVIPAHTFATTRELCLRDARSKYLPTYIHGTPSLPGANDAHCSLSPCGPSVADSDAQASPPS